MFTVEIEESNNAQLSGYDKSIPIDQFIGFVDSSDFLQGDSVSYSIWKDETEIYIGTFAKNGGSIETVVQKALNELWESGESIDDINLVAEAFELPLFSSQYSSDVSEDDRDMAQERAAPEPPRWHRWLWGIPVMVVIACIVAGFAYQKGNSAQVKVQPTYQQLLKAKDYKKIAKIYPNRVDGLEKELDQDKDDSGLAELADAGNEPAKFDLAFVKQQWSKVIDASDFPLNKEEKAKLAVAYALSGNSKAALIINDELKSQSLSELIFLSMIHQGQLSEADQMLQRSPDSKLSTILDAAKKYQAAYEKSAKDASNPKLSNEVREKATADKKNWLQLRQSLGGNLNYGE